MALSLPPGMLPPGMGPQPGMGPMPGPGGPGGSSGPNPQMLMMLPMLAQMFQSPQELAEAPSGERKREAPPKPDASTLLQDVDEAIDYWSSRDRRMDEDLELYRLNTTVEGVGADLVVIKNTPRVVVDKASAMVASAKYTIKMLPAREEHFSLAQDVEDFLRYCWRVWGRKWRKAQMQQSPEYAMGHFGSLRGWIAARVIYDPEADEGELPLKLRIEDPRNVYPSLGSDGVRFIVHNYPVTVGELMKEWPEAKQEYEDRDLTEVVEVKAYYDEWYHAVWVEDNELKPLTAHEYGINPWVVVPTFGSSVRASGSDETDWTEFAGVSIFDPIKNAYRQMNRTLSHLSMEVARQGDPAKIYYYDPGDEKPQEISTEPGVTNYAYTNERVDLIQLGTRPSDVQPLLESLNDDFSRGSLHPILWGQGANQSGLGLSVLTDPARDQLYPLIEGIEEAISQINEIALTILRDVHEGPVGYWSRDGSGNWRPGKTITPDMIEAVGTENEVKFSDIMPKDRMAMASMGAMLKDKNLLDPTTIRERYLEVENPDQVQERLLHDMIYMDEEAVKSVFVPLTLLMTDPQLFQIWMASKLMNAGMFGPGMGAPGESASAAGPGPQPGGPGSPPPPAQPPPPGEPLGLQAVAPQGPGLPSQVLSPLAQPGANPLAQAIGSALGGAGLQRAPGIPGDGAPQVRPPLIP